MSTSAVIAAMAASSAGAASAAAARAKKAECEAIIATFDPKNASVEIMKAYADCVNLIHPDPIDDGQTLILKMLFVIAIIGMGFGFYKGYQDEEIVYAILGGFLGFFIFPIVAIFLAFIFMGFQFLFS